MKQKSELLAHEVSFVRLRKRVNILASNSPVAIFAPSRSFGIGKSGKRILFYFLIISKNTHVKSRIFGTHVMVRVSRTISDHYILKVRGDTNLDIVYSGDE
jgi:hypothetical protein